MKLPSLSNVITQAFFTAKRFPFALVSALIGTFAAIVLTHHQGEEKFFWFNELLVVGILGISFLTALVLLAERFAKGKWLSVVLQLVGVGILVLYYLSLPVDVFSAPSVHGIRFALFAVGIHLLVAVIAFFVKNELNGFWQFNKTLFLRFLTGGLYSGVLFGGLALALEALKHLFGVPVQGEWYADLWFIMAGVFNTWFFLAGVPSDFVELNAVSEYPKGLKFFTQFILLPIITIYLVILYAYMGKILFSWDWPQGWVSGLILGFSITGIFSLLLIYPIKDLAGNVWMQSVARWFYRVLIPLGVMMLFAVWRRISEYGVTESRYIGIVVALWLIGISLYFVLSSTKNIKLIPITLCAIALLISFGLWGVFQVSLRSQMGRLHDVLSKANMLVGEKVKKPDHPPSFEDAQTISSIVHYICSSHSYDPLRPYFDVDLDTLGGQSKTMNARVRKFQDAQHIVGLMGIQYIDPWQERDKVYRYFVSDRAGITDLRGYSYAMHFQGLTVQENKQIATPDGKFSSHFSDSTITILFEGEGIRDSVVCNAAVLLDKIFYSVNDPSLRTLPAETMTTIDSSACLRAKACFHTISGKRGERMPLKSGFDVDVYFAKK